MVGAASGTQEAVALDAAYAHCLRLAHRHYENFTVLSWLTPRRLRRHRAALYAYCRTVDDLGDEMPGERLALLDAFEAQLDGAIKGDASEPLFLALADTIARFDLPREPFTRLIEANRIDQRSQRYASFEDVLHYCRHSANPVGRLVLMMHGYRDAERVRLSDATCTALQLANFWQDLARDAAAGRIYLPQDDMARFGVCDVDLSKLCASDALRALVRFQVDRARDLFAEGLGLLGRVSGHLRVELALFSRGGMAILDAIESQSFDTRRSRPTLSSSAKRRMIAETLFDLSVRKTPWRTQWI